MFAAEYPAVCPDGLPRALRLRALAEDCPRRVRPAPAALGEGAALRGPRGVGCGPVASEIGFDAAYGRSPYLKVCDSWPVGEVTAEVGELVRSDVPVLAMIGALGPYVRPDPARAGLGEFSNLSIVAPADGRNVVAKADCMLDTRNAWVDNPAMDPAGTACFAGARVAWDLR
jgi:hypothetical protein